MKKILTVLFALLLCFEHAQAMDVQEAVAPETGIKFWLVEDHKNPIISVNLSFKGGSEQDPTAKQGLASITASALTEGAGQYSASQFNQILSDNSIYLSFAASRDETFGEAKFLSEDKNKAFEMIELALTQPRFDTAEIERLKARQIASIRQQISDPEWQALYALLTKIFPAHPYGQRRQGSEQTVKSISLQDIKNFAASHYAKDNLTISIVGDISEDDAEQLVDRAFLKLPDGAKLIKIPNAGEEYSENNNKPIIVHRDGNQTYIAFHFPAPKRNDSDYHSAEIINYVLGGGGFSSRLMQEMRNKRGMTYGVHTSLSPSEHASGIYGSTSVHNSQANEALRVIRRSLRELCDKGISSQEISSAKDFLTGSVSLKLTSTDKIADMLTYMQTRNLGEDFIDRYPHMIRSTSDYDLKQAIDRWFCPDKMTVTMVGSPYNVTDAQVKEAVRQ